MFAGGWADEEYIYCNMGPRLQSVVHDFLD